MMLVIELRLLVSSTCLHIGHVCRLGVILITNLSAACACLPVYADIKKPSVLSEDSDEEPEPDAKIQIPFNKVSHRCRAARRPLLPPAMQQHRCKPAVSLLLGAGDVTWTSAGCL
jgi:hypothetical protein